MNGNWILAIFISLIILINAQYDDDRDLPQGINKNKEL
jgi:hypothetical protein